MDVIERVYSFIGWPLTAEAKAAMQRWLVEDEKAHQGGHEYTPEEFGLSAPQLQKDFAEYRKQHIQSVTPAKAGVQNP
jgi:hypothetical protein